MSIRVLIFPIVCLLVSGCVSKSSVQSMIDSNNEAVINPRLDQQSSRIGTLENQVIKARQLTETQRGVLIRHFELLGELSDNALAKLKEGDEIPPSASE